jgi:flagellar protein FlaG
MSISNSISAFPPIQPIQVPTSRSSEDMQQDAINSSKDQNTYNSLPNSEQLRNKEDYELTISDKAALKELEKILKTVHGIDISLSFSIHKETNQIMVKVINSETKEVIREIPPKKIVDMIASMMKNAGLLVDKYL